MNKKQIEHTAYWKSLRIPKGIKQEIDVLAAMQQRPVYEMVNEMLETWKNANGISISDLPRPDDKAAVVPVVTIRLGA